jgi:ABC-type antimicrobial peptide transport system permease subunit
MLIRELFSNVLRHPARFLILSLSLGLSSICVLFVLTVLRTSNLTTQPSIPENGAVFSVGLEEGASFQVSQISTLKGFFPEEIQVNRVRNLRGISLKAYGFASLESLQKHRPDVSLLRGSWAGVGEALVTPATCELTKCVIGQPLNIGADSRNNKNFLVRGIVQSSTPTAVLTVNPGPSFDAFTKHFWLTTSGQKANSILYDVLEELESKKLSGVVQDEVDVQDRQTQQSDFKLVNYTFLALLGPLAAIALFSAALLVVFNFAVNRLERAKETAIKRALGASRLQIMLESLGEASVVFLLAAVPALLLGLSSLGLMNRILGQEGGQTLFYPEWQLLVRAGSVVLMLVLLSAIGPILSTVREKPSLRLKEE